MAVLATRRDVRSTPRERDGGNDVDHRGRSREQVGRWVASMMRLMCRMDRPVAARAMTRTGDGEQLFLCHLTSFSFLPVLLVLTGILEGSSCGCGPSTLISWPMSAVCAPRTMPEAPGQPVGPSSQRGAPGERADPVRSRCGPGQSVRPYGPRSAYGICCDVGLERRGNWPAPGAAPVRKMIACAISRLNDAGDDTGHLASAPSLSSSALNCSKFS